MLAPFRDDEDLSRPHGHGAMPELDVNFAWKHQEEVALVCVKVRSEFPLYLDHPDILAVSGRSR